jgi:hypothetical protein
MTMLLSVAVKPTEAHASTVLGGGWDHKPHPVHPPHPIHPPHPKYP